MRIIHCFAIFFVLMENQLQAKTLLITGATGFVGRAVLDRAIKSEDYDKIYVAVRNEAKFREVMTWLGYSDETIPPELELLVGGGPAWGFDKLEVDHVIHTAGLTSAANDEEYYQANVESTTSLMARLKNPGRIIIYSSLAAAGPSSARGPIEKVEHDFNEPITGYGRSKLAMEQALKTQFSDYNYLVLRPPMVLGPGDVATESLLTAGRGMIIPRPMRTWREAVHRYSFIYSEDLVTATFVALNSEQDFRTIPFRFLYVSDQQIFSSHEMFATARSVVGGRGPIIPVPIPLVKALAVLVEYTPSLRAANPTMRLDRSNDASYSWVNCSDAFTRRFGVKFNTGLKEALTEANSKR